MCILETGVFRWLNVFGVDNVLARIADPAFLGAVITEHKSAAVKAVLKKNPSENVGVVCEKNGHPSIIEYFELGEKMAAQRDENGELLYCAGVTVNYLFNASILLSTAGVVVMGLEKITFGWYMKHISWVAFLGYLAGILCYWIEKTFIF